MTTSPHTIDPITFEILSHRLYQIAKEMGTTLERVGGTVNTTQHHDYMASLYRANGDILASGESIAWHVACGGFTVKRIIEQFENEEGINPDDVFLLNDPYVTAIHQSDVYLVSPHHLEGRLLGWSASFVHVMDIGAMSPGGSSPGARHVVQEGIRIPGIKLVDGGRLRRDVFNTITNMTRQPMMVGLDLKSELAANNVAKARVKEMYAQYGVDVIEAVTTEMIRQSEKVLRQRISEFPRGSWSASATIEGDKENAWTIAVTVHNKGDHLLFDFTGTDEQAPLGINLPFHATFGACFEAVVNTLGRGLPRNHGLMAPIKVIAPEGTVVNVRYPGPVSMNTTSSGGRTKFVARSALIQMLAGNEKWRYAVMALSGGSRNARPSGLNQYGVYFAASLAQSALSGGGARTERDGLDSSTGDFNLTPNVEWMERNYPMLLLFRRQYKDGGGAGKFRGGVGTELALTVHDAPEGNIKAVAYGVAGLKNVGRGIFGGYPGLPSVIALLQGTKLREVLGENRCPVDIADLGGNRQALPYCEFEVKQEDVLYLRLSSGGGYGDPLDRDPRLVLNDVINGFVSKMAAHDVYGVVLSNDGLIVDISATEKFRATLRGERLVPKNIQQL